MLRTARHFLLHMWHPSCYSCYKYHIQIEYSTSLFFLLSFFLWPLYFLSFDFRFLITPLVLQTFPIFIQNELKVFSAIIYKMSAMLWCSVSMVKEIADQGESDKLLINVITKYSSMYERRSHTQLAPGSARITSNDVLNANVLLCHTTTTTTVPSESVV
jgi:hypothetical protein